MKQVNLGSKRSDQDLIRAIREGGRAERNAMNYINGEQKFLQSLHKFIHHNNGQASDVKPVFNDGLLSLYNKIKKLPESKIDNFNLWGYLFTSCRNIWYKELKTKAKSRSFLSTLGGKIKKAFSREKKGLDQLDRDKLKIVEDLIDQLGEPDCSVLLMSEKGLSHKEIAKELGITENNSRQILRRAKIKLLNDFDKRFPGER